MRIEEQIPLLEEILSRWTGVIGSEYQGYRNHAYRMIHFCLALRECSDVEREKIVIAGAFHDIGIWIEDTFEYIAPSVSPALEYLQQRHLERWSQEVSLMITEHHKIRRFGDETSPLVEIFRKGDLVDVSLGTLRCGIPKSWIDLVRATFPNADFHRNLVKRAARWFLQHPLNPAPMMKW